MTLDHWVEKCHCSEVTPSLQCPSSCDSQHVEASYPNFCKTDGIQQGCGDCHVGGDLGATHTVLLFWVAKGSNVLETIKAF